MYICIIYLFWKKKNEVLFVLSWTYFVFPTASPYFYSPSAGASALLRSSVKLGPSSVTSASSSAWLWRNRFKSTGHRTEWGSIHWSVAWHCDWQSQSAYRGPGDGQTAHLQVRRGGMRLIDWRAVTEPLGHHKTIPAPAGQQYYVGAQCVLACEDGCVCERGGPTCCTLRVVTKTGAPQVGPAHIFKARQN